MTQIEASAQFAPQVGQAGTSAIYKDSSAILSWATQCTLNRGWQNIADTTLGRTTVGDESSATGKAGNGVVSLGDGGDAVVTFAHPIINGDGPDFAIFENGFITDSLAFLELAFVEVSSDGINFVRFPSVSNVDTLQQINYFTGINASQLNNLAGKYIGMYGTPFDLAELHSLPGLDVNHITHIKITDVVGSVQSLYATRDSRNRIINDPWPTPFASSGFDLDAVAVLHEDKTMNVNTAKQDLSIQYYPNPLLAGETFYIHTEEAISNVKLTDANGKSIPLMFDESASNTYRTHIDFSKGFYILQVQCNDKIITKKIVIQ